MMNHLHVHVLLHLLLMNVDVVVVVVPNLLENMIFFFSSKHYCTHISEQYRQHIGCFKEKLTCCEPHAL